MVIDWNAKPEPWRSIGLNFLAEINDKPTIVIGETPGARLRELRRRKEWPIKKACYLTGISETTLTLVESDRRSPIRPIRAALARLYGVLESDIWPE